VNARSPQSGMGPGRVVVDVLSGRPSPSVSPDEIDWVGELAWARRHRVWPLLESAWDRAAAWGAPWGVRERLASDTLAGAARGLFLAGEMLRLIELLRSNDIRVLPLKGPALGVQLYGDLAHRLSGDLDLVVPPECLPRARALMLGAGFTQHAHADGALLLEGPNRLIVELHWAFAPRQDRFGLPVRQVMDRAGKVELLGSVVPAASAEDLLLLLCQHGSKHAWERFKWICDIRQLLHVYPELDWAVVMQRSRRLRVRRIVLLGLCLARDFLGAALPPAVEMAARRDPAIPALVEEVRRRLHGDSLEPISFVERSLFHVRARECRRDRLARLAWMAGTFVRTQVIRAGARVRRETASRVRARLRGPRTPLGDDRPADRSRPAAFVLAPGTATAAGIPRTQILLRPGGCVRLRPQQPE